MDRSPSRRGSYRSGRSPERHSRRRSLTISMGRRLSRSRSRNRHRSRSYSPPERVSEDSSPPRRRHRSRSGSSSPDRPYKSRWRSRGRKCWKCPATFRSNPALQDHIRSGGCRYTREVKVHKCYYCRVEFSSAPSLMAHIEDKQHRLPKSTIMAIQGDNTRASASSNLTGSMDKLILLEKPADEFFQCHVCPKKFFDKTSLYQHMASLNHFTKVDREKGLDKMLGNVGPSKSGTYACVVCRKTFLDQGALLYHVGATKHFLPEGERRPHSSSPSNPAESVPSALLQAAPPPPVMQTHSGGRFVQSLVSVDNNNKGLNQTVHDNNGVQSPGLGATELFPFPANPPQTGHPNISFMSRFTSPPASPEANVQYLCSLMKNSPSPTAPVFSEVDRTWNPIAISFDPTRQAPTAVYRNSTPHGYPPPAPNAYDHNAYALGQRYIPYNSRPIESLNERMVIIPQNNITANTGYMGAQPQYGAYHEEYGRPNVVTSDALQSQDPRRKTQVYSSVDSRKGNNSPQSSGQSINSSTVTSNGPPLAPLDDMMAPRILAGSFTRTSAVQQKVPGTILPGPVLSPPVLRPPAPSPPVLRLPVPFPSLCGPPEATNVYDSLSNIPPPRVIPEVPVINAHSDRFANAQPVTPFRVEVPHAGLVPSVPVVSVPSAPPPPIIPAELRIQYNRVSPPIPLEELPRFSPEVEPPPVEEDRPVTPETPTEEPEDPFVPRRLPDDDVERYSPDVVLGEEESGKESDEGKEKSVMSKKEMLLGSVPEFCSDCNNPLDPVFCLSYNVVHRRWHVCCIKCGWETVAMQ